MKKLTDESEANVIEKLDTMSLPINSDLLKIKNDLKNIQGQFNRSGTEMG